MRILHVVTRHRRGGAERNLLATIDWEVRNGHRVEVAVGEEGLVRNFPPGVVLHVMRNMRRSPHLLRDIKATAELARIMRFHQFDVIHTHQSKAGVIGRLAAPRNATVVHTVHMPSFGKGYGAHVSWLFRNLERVCALRTDYMIAVGSEVRSIYLSEGIGRAARFGVIRSPIDLAPLAELRNCRYSRDRPSALISDLHDFDHVVLSLGALDPRKRNQLAVRELVSVLVRRNAVLLIAGQGPERDEITSVIAHLGAEFRVRLLGHVDDVRSLFAVADVLVHTSETEGVPQVVLQALAAGVPVVATAAEGLNEVPGAPIVRVAHDGTGLRAAVEAVLSRSVATHVVPFQALAAWSPECVEQDIAQLHELLEVSSAHVCRRT